MTNRRPGGLLPYLRGLLGTRAAGETEGGPSDGQLLERFVTLREEAAFAVLVRRHGGMVYAVCRRLLGRSHEAEDAFQATFLVLIRKAATLDRRGSVAGWLYRVAYRVAVRARAKAARWRQEPQQVLDMLEADPDKIAAQQELRGVLDEELNRLPEKYRLPVVLCYLEGQTNDEAARHLGWPKGTVSGRLARARDLLRSRLARRGLAPSVAVLAAALEAYAGPPAVPAALAEGIVKAAVPALLGPGVGASFAPSVRALAEDCLRALLLARLRRGLLGLLLLGTVVVVLWLVFTGKGREDIAPAAVRATDREHLQGGWEVVEAEMGGRQVPPQGLRMVFAGDECTLSLGGAPALPATYHLDPSRTPKWIDFRKADGTVTLGIYRLEGDKLTLCSNEGGGDRPTAFATDPADGFMRLVLRRR